MPDDVNARMVDVHPSVPHDLMRPKRVFGNSHGVHLSAAPVIFRTAIVSIGIGEDDVDAAGTHACSGSGTFAPIIEPASDVFDG